MSNIKTELIEQTPSPAMDIPYERPENQQSSAWDASMELVLLKAIAACKPVGLHKNFRIMCVQRQFNQKSPLQCSIKEIWDRLSQYYGMNSLNELEEDKQDTQALESQQDTQGWYEFSLPFQFNNDKVMQEKPTALEMPLPKRVRIHRRDVSPTTAESSVASTPEPSEATPFRRTGRSTRKSDFGTPEPGITRSSTTSLPSSFSSPSPSTSSYNSNRRSYRASFISKNNTAMATHRRQSKRK